MSISFLADKFAHIPTLNSNFTTPESKAKSVTILGSSVTSEALSEYMDLCSKVTKGLIENGYNVVSGCGATGIMGATYKSAKDNSLKDVFGKPIQNLAIVVEPAWGDEDIENCIPIGKATSEPDRITKFSKVSDNFIVFPGGESTLLETTSLIQKNKYPEKGENFKKIILVGQQIFSGLINQYQALFELGTVSKPPDQLFKVLNSEKEILKEFPKLNKLI